VAIRGVFDIRGMLRRLAAGAALAEGKKIPPDSPR
jgi:hypothetical protein